MNIRMIFLKPLFTFFGSASKFAVLIALAVLYESAISSDAYTSGGRLQTITVSYRPRFTQRTYYRSRGRCELEEQRKPRSQP